MSKNRIARRVKKTLSPWLTLVSKDVQFFNRKGTEKYHAFRQSDYVAIFARCENGLIPIVSQYRPAVENVTWEFPAGLLDKGEDPKKACHRELKEEAGILAKKIIYMGSYFADTGRLENRIHNYFVFASNPKPNIVIEPNIDVKFVTAKALKKLILKGEFSQQMHLGLLMLATWKGIQWE